MKHAHLKLLVAAVWIGAEGVALWLLGALIIIERPSEYAGRLLDPGYLVIMAAMLTAILVVQSLFLLPVREPAYRQSSPTPLNLSIGVAGFAIALLVAGGVMGVINLLNLLPFDLWVEEWLGIGWIVLLGSWAVTTPLLIAFSKRCMRETYLAKLATILFVGTVVELLAVVPVNVIARRRSGCYSGEASTFSLTACLAVGIFALGPGILLVALARRRRRWYEGRCPICGYDLNGLPAATRCPECGAGWRTETMLQSGTE